MQILPHDRVEGELWLKQSSGDTFTPSHPGGNFLRDWTRIFQGVGALRRSGHGCCRGVGDRIHSGTKGTPLGCVLDEQSLDVLKRLTNTTSRSISPCEQVIEKTCLIHYPERVIELFPDDPDLVKLNAVSYAGVPLLRADGTVLGHLSALAMQSHSILDPTWQERCLHFAVRAAAELNRIRAESAVHGVSVGFRDCSKVRWMQSSEPIATFASCEQMRQPRRCFRTASWKLKTGNLTSFLTATSAQRLSDVAEQMAWPSMKFRHGFRVASMPFVRAERHSLPKRAYRASVRR